MRKSPKHNNGINPLQRLSHRSKIVQVFTYLSIMALMVSAALIFLDRSQKNEYGFYATSEINQLLETSAKEDKYSLIKFDAPYCFPCTHDNPIDGKTYFESVADQYVMYQLNALDLAGEGPQLTKYYKIEVLPTWLVLNSEGVEVYRWESYGLPPAEKLGQLEALRELTVPAPAAQRSFEEPEILSEQVFTLNWQSNLSYWDAIRMAEKLEPMVLESVWTQPDSSGAWSVCSGTYHGIIEARKSRLFHTEWREHPLQIVPLKESGWELPSH